MIDLLFLAHRLPFPPNKGDKIRSYNIVRELTQHFRVHVGTFVDDESDLQYVKTFDSQVSTLHSEFLNRSWSKLKSAKALLSGEPLSTHYFRSASMQRWIDKAIIEKNIRLVMCFSSVMAQYVAHQTQVPRFMDFIDMDSDKWRQYSEHSRPPLSWVYSREARCLLQEETSIAEEFSYSWFVSEAEAASFRSSSGFGADRVGWFSNGVDLNYFSHDEDRRSPYGPDDLVCVFTGAMDYFANVDAVVWFCEQVWPKIREQQPEAWFYIVGSNPSHAVLALEALPGVRVTGRVADVRPFVQHARCAVAPLRIARGIQNKVLEALALCKPVVCTPAAAEGLRDDPVIQSLTFSAPETFAKSCLQWLDASEPQMRFRHYVEAHYQWATSLSPLIARLQECALT